MTAAIKQCWIVTETGLTGTENQCLGVAEALGVMPEIKRIGLKPPWKSLSPWLGFEHAGIFTGDALEPPYPDILIAAGRKAISAARFIKKASGGKTFTVFLQDPHINPQAFDLVAVPAHDNLCGENVIVTTATPNRITAPRLAAAKEEWASQFSALPAPHIAVLIGGNSKTHRMTPEIVNKLSEQLKSLEASLMITTSRRTGAANETILKDALEKRPHTYFYDGQGDNPYFGMLAFADYILVTSDSASMLSDAATTGKPVYMIALAGGSPKFDRLYEQLTNKKALRPFQGALENWCYSPINDAELIAHEITKRMKGFSHD